MLRLLRPFWLWLLVAALGGGAAGAATVALLARLNAVLHQSDAVSQGLLGALVGLSAVTLLGRAVSLIATNRVGQRLVAQVRQALARKILAAPIDALERYRTHRLMPVLTHDIDMISGTVFAFAALAISLAVTLGCLLYLAWLSPQMFGLLMIALGLGALIQRTAQKRANAGFENARSAEERLHKAYHSIGEGAKELRLHRRRRQGVFERQVLGTIEEISRVNSRAIDTFVIAGAFGSALYFLLIALVLGWSLRHPLAPSVVSGFMLVLLYLKGPIDQTASILPAVGRARVALGRIADLSARFSTPEPIPLEGGTARPAPAPTLRECIELRGVCYAYEPREDHSLGEDGEADEEEDENEDSEGGEPFTVGPLNLRIDKGSIVFIVGENGSGKTTLIKLLLGLYAPHRGQVLLDGEPVTTQARDDYRQLFGTVFSDFYLFEELVDGEARTGLGSDGGGESQAAASAQAAALAYLKRLDIAHKVKVREGAFSTVDLSTGQRKRLALVHAYLEGRQVLVFDEWAADQDPAFRRLFYRQLLPELRAQGHTLVVISHDERYFDVADQLVRISGGRICTRREESLNGTEAVEVGADPQERERPALDDAVAAAA